MNRSLEELLADRCASIPNRRIADPMDIANVAHFLCSTDASHMIGCVVDIEGGESLLA